MCVRKRPIVEFVEIVLPFIHYFNLHTSLVHHMAYPHTTYPLSTYNWVRSSLLILTVKNKNKIVKIGYKWNQNQAISSSSKLQAKIVWWRCGGVDASPNRSNQCTYSYIIQSVQLHVVGNRKSVYLGFNNINPSIFVLTQINFIIQIPILILCSSLIVPRTCWKLSFSKNKFSQNQQLIETAIVFTTRCCWR